MMLTTLFKKILIFSTFSMLLMMMSSNHPITLSIFVIMQSIMMATMVTMTFNFSWFSYLVFMIYLGGILMLFCYIISISFSSQPLIKMKSTTLFISIIVSFTIFSEETFLEIKKVKISEMIMPLYTKNLNLTLFFLNLLFFVMISVIFITEKEKKSIKIKYN